MKINNQISADLQFIGDSIKKIQVLNNLVYLTGKEKREFGIDINVIDINRGQDNIFNGLVDLDIIANVGDKSAKKKTKIEITIEGCFVANNPNLTEKQFATMLFINGGSVLYSIARTLICSISANIYESGKLMLPMVNVIEFLKEKIKAMQEAKEKTKKVSSSKKEKSKENNIDK